MLQNQCIFTTYITYLVHICYRKPQWLFCYICLTVCYNNVTLVHVTVSHPVRVCYRRRMHSTGSRSAIDFGAWSRTPLTRAIVDEELQLQKKRHFPHPHAPQPQRRSHQPRPHPPTYEPRVNFQAGPSMVEPQPFGVEPQPSVVEPQTSVVEPQASVVEPQPSMVEPQPPMVEPQPPMVEPQLSMVEPQPRTSVVKPQPQMSVFEPQSHRYTHKPQPHTYPAMPGAIAPSNPYVIAC